MRWLDEIYRDALAPEPPLSVSEWADRYRVLPPTSAEPGRWRTSRTPYLHDIMDALSPSSPSERVVFMKAAQIGATEAGLNWLGYIIAHMPGLALVVQPSLDMALRNTRTRLDPMIAATPALRERIAPPRSRNSQNTGHSKSFPGGQLILTGANSASALRSTPVRYLFLDEIDGYPHDIDGEGDPVALAIQRTVTFKGRRKIFLVSTPTLSGTSRIEAAYAESDQRNFFVPCPHCREFQVLTWSGVHWPEGEPQRAYYACVACGGVIEERDKSALLAAGEWRATAVSDVAGFHISALYSPFESWAAIAGDFLAARQDPARLQAWTNLKLGEAFEDRETAPLAADTLMARAEASDASWAECLPEGVAVLVAGADIQADRIELEIVGFGRAEESWSVDYQIIHGDTAKPDVWESLDRSLTRRFPHAKAVPDLPIMAACIDSGFRTDVVMRFCAERANRRVWAIKGRGGAGVPAWPRRPPKARKRALAPVFITGIDALKQTLFARLRPAEPSGPAVCHFPAERDHFWFAGLVSERAVRKYHRGVPRIEFVRDRGVRNEPLDARVYAMAGLHGLYAAGFQLEDAVKRVSEAELRGRSFNGAEVPVPATKRSVIRSNWMSR